MLALDRQVLLPHRRGHSGSAPVGESSCEGSILTELLTTFELVRRVQLGGENGDPHEAFTTDKESTMPKVLSLT